MEVKHKFDLEKMLCDHLVSVFRKFYNKMERSLRLLDEWSTMFFTAVAKKLPTASFEEQTDTLLETRMRPRLYLKTEI